MKGTNVLKLNGATMCDALREYLVKRMPEVKGLAVTEVTKSNERGGLSTHDFDVTVTVPEDPAP